MKREEVSEESKKEFSDKVNEQAGRTSKGIVLSPKSMSQAQLMSWNNDGYILIPNFLNEEDCDAMDKEVLKIINNIIPEGSAFSHAYAGDGHIAIREMKPSPNAKRIEDEISKLFRIHSKGVFNDFIHKKLLGDILEDILGPDVDCFLSQYIFKNPGAWGQPWHQDSSYFPFDREPQVAAWLATSEATLENGCLVVLPGSHLSLIHI